MLGDYENAHYLNFKEAHTCVPLYTEDKRKFAAIGQCLQILHIYTWFLMTNYWSKWERCVKGLHKVF